MSQSKSSTGRWKQVATEHGGSRGSSRVWPRLLGHPCTLQTSAAWGVLAPWALEPQTHISGAPSHYVHMQLVFSTAASLWVANQTKDLGTNPCQIQLWLAVQSISSLQLHVLKAWAPAEAPRCSEALTRCSAQLCAAVHQVRAKQPASSDAELCFSLKRRENSKCSCIFQFTAQQRCNPRWVPGFGAEAQLLFRGISSPLQSLLRTKLISHLSSVGEEMSVRPFQVHTHSNMKLIRNC